MLEVLQDYYRGFITGISLAKIFIFIFLEDRSLFWVSKPEWAPLFTICMLHCNGHVTVS